VNSNNILLRYIYTSNTDEILNRFSQADYENDRQYYRKNHAYDYIQGIPRRSDIFLFLFFNAENKKLKN